MARAPALAETESYPEADRLEGFPHPRATPRLFGHAGAEQTLAEALASGRMHHAWLLSGPLGVGKSTLAYKFARAALSGGGASLYGASLESDAASPVARQIMAQSHPGLLVIRRPYDTKTKRFAATLPVDEVRRLKSFLQLSTDEGGWRVVIVDSADDMNASAANALLKSLEEPPPRTVFLILSSEPGRLLATIRSRCRRLALEGLSDEELVAAVRQAFGAADKTAPTADEFKNLLPLSGGSVRRLINLHSGGGLDLQARIEKIFARLPTLDRGHVHPLAEELSSSQAEEKFELFFELLSGHLARTVKAAAKGEGGGPNGGQDAPRFLGPGRVAAFAQLWETLAREKAECLSLNLDRKALILDMFLKIEAAAQG